MEQKPNKIYSKQTTKGGLHFWFDIEDLHLTLRFAGNPSILLEYYRNEYGVEGEEHYLKLLRLLDKIGEDGLSPFVMYTNKRRVLQPEDPRPSDD